MDPLEQFDEVLAFSNTLDPETDRGCALMAAAYLDDQLKILIERTLVQNAKLQEAIFEPNGSLGTFAARIDFAYLLGCIGPRRSEICTLFERSEMISAILRSLLRSTIRR